MPKPTEPAAGLEEGGPGTACGASPQRLLYLVATVHLDTQWRWTVQRTIRDFLPATLRENFALFERFPFFVLSFEGAFRYLLVKEYYPADYERLREYVAAGRWRVAGSMLDAPDVNVVSPESLIRHILYGNRFFEKEFGKPSCDLFLPDSFGFGHALPSIAAHCGLKGFSSQKFGNWLAPAELPFELGVWEGPDGAGVVAALRPEGYGDGLDEDLSSAARWVARIDKTGSRSGVYVGFKYVGVGDRGGALDGASVEWIGRSLEADRPIRVVHTSSDQLFRDLSPEEIARLPRHRGELLLPTHGNGCYTAQAVMKRWNRRNELLADAAERAAAAADWLRALPYPRERLTAAWIRFLWHQMHDDLTGTSIPPAYGFSWNDQLIALNQFSDVLTTSIGALVEGLDTRCEGSPLVVYNPLSIAREDLATARLPSAGIASSSVRVFGPDGREVPAQVQPAPDGSTKVTFLARLPPLGWAVYDLRRAERPCDLETGLRVTPGSLENQRYRVEVNGNGDLARLLDKRLDLDLLQAPAELHLLPDRSARWPAWELRYADLTSRQVKRVGGPAEIRIVERGPARVCLEVRRAAGGSRFVQRLRLACGEAGERLEIETRIDWHTRGRLLKAVFPLAVSHPRATYDLGLGTIERPNNTREKYEVPAQQWADLSSREGSFGVSILNDSKYGWDKPDDSTLRLTLLRSPRVLRKFRHQGSQDHGRHRFVYALYGHRGDWRQGGSTWQAARLNQPPMAFRAPPSTGPLGRSFSFARTSTAQVTVAALKKAEEGDEMVIRLQETEGRPARGVELAFAAPLREAREVDGMERPRGPAVIRDGRLLVDLRPFQPRAFAVRLEPSPSGLEAPRSLPLPLPFDVVATSFHAPRTSGDFDGRGNTLPGELFPSRLTSGGVEFRLGPASPGRANALACRGQRLELPADEYRKLHLLAASTGGDRWGEFQIGDRSVEIRVQHYTGSIGRWKAWRRGLLGWAWARPGTGFLKRDPIAWVATHRHAPGVRDEPYVFCYLFRYVVALPRGGRSLRLPDEPGIRLFALSLSDETISDTAPAVELYDGSGS